MDFNKLPKNLKYKIEDEIKKYSDDDLNTLISKFKLEYQKTTHQNEYELDPNFKSALENINEIFSVSLNSVDIKNLDSLNEIKKIELPSLNEILHVQGVAQLFELDSQDVEQQSVISDYLPIFLPAKAVYIKVLNANNGKENYLTVDPMIISNVDQNVQILKEHTDLDILTVNTPDNNAVWLLVDFDPLIQKLLDLLKRLVEDTEFCRGPIGRAKCETLKRLIENFLQRVLPTMIVNARWWTHAISAPHVCNSIIEPGIIRNRYLYNLLKFSPSLIPEPNSDYFKIETSNFVFGWDSATNRMTWFNADIDPEAGSLFQIDHIGLDTVVPLVISPYTYLNYLTVIANNHSIPVSGPFEKTSILEKIVNQVIDKINEKSPIKFPHLTENDLLESSISLGYIKNKDLFSIGVDKSPFRNKTMIHESLKNIINNLLQNLDSIVKLIPNPQDYGTNIFDFLVDFSEICQPVKSHMYEIVARDFSWYLSNNSLNSVIGQIGERIIKHEFINSDTFYISCPLTVNVFEDPNNERYKVTPKRIYIDTINKNTTVNLQESENDVLITDFGSVYIQLFKDFSFALLDNNGHLMQPENNTVVWKSIQYNQINELVNQQPFFFILFLTELITNTVCDYLHEKLQPILDIIAIIRLIPGLSILKLQFPTCNIIGTLNYTLEQLNVLFVELEIVIGGAIAYLSGLSIACPPCWVFTIPLIALLSSILSKITTAHSNTNRCIDL